MSSGAGVLRETANTTTLAGKAADLLATDPWWIILIKIVGIFAVLVVLVIILVWMERRVVGRMQQRPGPNRAGPFGLLQSIGDALKMAFKEDIRPAMADKWVYFIAPTVAVIPAFAAISVIPMSGELSLFGHRTVLQLADLPVGILVVLACSSVGVYGILLGGWAAGSPYPLLGALRGAAQVISYEIAMGLSIIAVVLYSQSMSTSEIVEAQATQIWFMFSLLPSFVIYVISMVGETNRPPFDLPEAESELVAGYQTEYSSSLKFAMFYLAEYINMVTVSALATTMFLGGWRAPFGLSLIGDGYFNTGWWPLLWFAGKVLALLFGFIWLRGALPRLRYDQFMKLGWKVLVPASLVWFLMVTTVRVIRNSGTTPTQILVIGGIGLAVLLLLAFLIPDRQVKDTQRVPMAGSGYPVPPLDLRVPKKPKRRTAAPVAKTPVNRPKGEVTVGAGGSDDSGSVNAGRKEATDGTV